MRDFSAIFSRLVGLTKLPWLAISTAVGVGFLLAAVLSTLLGELLIPSFKSTPQENVSSLSVDRAKSDGSLNKAAIDAIIKRNIFNIEGKTGEEEEKVDTTPGGAPVKTTLPLTLVGLIYGGDPYSGIALIKNNSKNSINSFMVGDNLLADAKILEILQDRVILQRSRNREFIELEIKAFENKRRKKDPNAKKDPAAVDVVKSGKKAPASYKEEGFERNGNAIVISTDFRQKLLTSDFAKVLQDVKAEPNMVGNELNGFRLTRIRPDSVFEKSGLLDGDVVKEVNGVSLVDPGQAIKLLNGLRGESEIEVRVERDGSPLTLSMKVR
jgi:type II secretion system protein C